MAVPPEVVGHGDQERRRRGEQVVDVEGLDEDREDDEVDDVAAGADDAEADQLVPIVALAHAAADAPVQASTCGRRGGGLVGHAPEDTDGATCSGAAPKWSSVIAAASRMVHCRRAERSSGPVPHHSSAPCESLRCSEPCAPPPTWSAPPQSGNS